MMRIRRQLLSLIGLAVLVSATMVVAAPQDAEKKAKPHAKIGEAAPAFTLSDAEGKATTLAEYKGKIVVLQWINPDCPVCARVTKSGLVADMLKQIKEIDPTVVHLAINSTHYQDATIGAKYFQKNEIASTVLVDQDGTVGRIYGARTTPHLFVIDKEGILRFDGAINDDPPGTKGMEATNYVVNAVRQITDGETVAPDKVQPYGCSVKYKRDKS